MAGSEVVVSIASGREGMGKAFVCGNAAAVSNVSNGWLTRRAEEEEKKGVSQGQLDFTKAQHARDRGIARTRAHTGEAWFERALADFVRFACERGEATVEQWRFDWLARGLPAPASHYSYGALGRTAASRGHVVFVKYVKAQAEKTHCHPVALWRAK